MNKNYLYMYFYVILNEAAAEFVQQKIETWEMCLLHDCLLHTVWGLLLSAVEEMPLIPLKYVLILVLYLARLPSTNGKSTGKEKGVHSNILITHAMQ